jgi:hypothetical protein
MDFTAKNSNVTAEELGGARQKEGVQDIEQRVNLATSWILHSGAVRGAHKNQAESL